MKRFCLAFILGIITVFWIGSAIAANTVSEAGKTVEVSGIDSDFTYTGPSTLAGPYSRGARIDFIVFIPGSGTNDVVSIKEGSDSGPNLFYYQARDVNDAHIQYYHGARLRPVLDYSASSLSSGARVIFQLWREQ